MSSMHDERVELWRQAEEVSTPVGDELVAEADWRRIADWEDEPAITARADRHLENAAYLAAAEARFKGYIIEGWDSEWADKTVRDFYNTKLGSVASETVVKVNLGGSW